MKILKETKRGNKHPTTSLLYGWKPWYQSRYRLTPKTNNVAVHSPSRQLWHEFFIFTLKKIENISKKKLECCKMVENNVIFISNNYKEPKS